MDVVVARDIAQRSYVGQRNRFGEELLEHVRRVAEAVPPEARPLAWLHDVLERSRTSLEELRCSGLTPQELEALELLTRTPSEPYTFYVLRIARAGGEPGRLARTVKLADLDDHLAHSELPRDAPPYAWARRRLAAARARLGEAVPVAARRAREGSAR